MGLLKVLSSLSGNPKHLGAVAHTTVRALFGMPGVFLVAVTAIFTLSSLFPRPVPVVLIGGSAVAGWHDSSHQGYVVRAIRRYSKSTGVHFAVANHAIPGARVINPTVASNFDRWMMNTRGGVVVIAWGLNDIRLHTPLPVILQIIRQEITDALNTGHRVWIISPPATTPSTTFDHTAAKNLWNHIAALGLSFHSRAVRLANVMGPMESLVHKRHQPINHYMQGEWDPNTRGHKLAARILVRELEKRRRGKV